MKNNQTTTESKIRRIWKTGEHMVNEDHFVDYVMQLIAKEKKASALEIFKLLDKEATYSENSDLDPSPELIINMEDVKRVFREALAHSQEDREGK